MAYATTAQETCTINISRARATYNVSIPAPGKDLTAKFPATQDDGTGDYMPLRFQIMLAQGAYIRAGLQVPRFIVRLSGQPISQEDMQAIREVVRQFNDAPKDLEKIASSSE